jgi:hypothetical protein
MSIEEILQKLHDRGAVDATLKNGRIQFPDGERMHVHSRWKFQHDLIELVDDRDPNKIKYCYIKA